MGKKWSSDAEQQAFFLTRKVDRAIREHDMIDDGDKILVGVSGGKDSMSMLKLLIHWLRYSPKKYELVAAHVRGDARGTGYEIPESFGRWLEDQGVPFEIRDIVVPENEQLPMACERCARNRRRTLFEMARDHKCNKLALAHNLDDFAHTALMNLFSSGRLETMAFRRVYFDGLFTLIRPLAYIRERELVRFAKTCEFPVIASGCPMAPLSDRESARDLMRSVSKEFRSANINIVRAACRENGDLSL